MTWRSLLSRPGVLYFLILPYFIPYSISFVPSLTLFYNLGAIWKLFSVVAIFFLYFTRFPRISKPVLTVFLLHLTLTVSSILNGLSDSSFYTELLIPVALVMLVEMSLCTLDSHLILRILFRIFAFLAFVNFMFTILYPEGLPFATLYTKKLNPLYFWGQDNGIVYNLLVVLALNYILREVGEQMIKLSLLSGKYFVTFYPRIIFYDVICFLTVLVVGSATGLMVILLFLALIKTSYAMRKKQHIWILFVGYLLFFFSVIVFGNSNPLVTEVADLLGRDAGFTGRSLLWEHILYLIQQKIVLGWGNNSNIIRIWNDFFSAHNQFLDVMARGGIVTMFLYACLHVSAFIHLRRTKNQLANIIFITIFCFLVGGLMEAGVRATQYIFVLLAFYLHLI
ncbi:O-antigen ligase family protein [Streptococcus suis]